MCLGGKTPTSCFCEKFLVMLAEKSGEKKEKITMKKCNKKTQKRWMDDCNIQVESL